MSSEKMPSMRKRVSSFLRHLGTTGGHSDVPKAKSESSGSFIQRYLSGVETKKQEPTILHGRTAQELPPLAIGDVSTKAEFAAVTGPNGGLTMVNPIKKHLTTSDPDVDYIDILEVIEHQDASFPEESSSKPLTRKDTIAGVTDWNRPHHRAYGLSTTLYEKNPVTKQHAGNPIADCYAVVARENSAILALADGVNWGEKACIAARSAVHGCVDYLNNTLFNPFSTKPTNTTEVFIALLRSFHVAHSLILQEEGMLTTLTAAVVLPLLSTGKQIACVCNVGDSLAFVFSPKHGVREITKGSHDIHCMRDMRDALGALGPVDGTNPELGNLTCSMTEVNEGDIIFLTSDGVSDNFDPVVGKFAVMPNSNKSDVTNQNHNLPVVQAIQRHELTLLRMDDLLRHGVSGNGPICSNSRELCTRLLDFAIRLTSAKRKILEDSDLYFTETDGVKKELTKNEQKVKRKEACSKLILVPGKLDHATVVAYNVGRCDKNSNDDIIPVCSRENVKSTNGDKNSCGKSIDDSNLFETAL